MTDKTEARDPAPGDLAALERLARAAKNAVGFAQYANAWEAIEVALQPDTLLHLIALARSAEAAEGGWQPIETAPKDRPVDLWIVAGDYGRREPDATWGLPDHCCGEAGQYCDSDFHYAEPGWLNDLLMFAMGEDEEATHWCPLPAPPVTLNKEPHHVG